VQEICVMTLMLVTLQTIRNNSRDYKRQDSHTVFSLRPLVFVSKQQVTALRFTSCIGNEDLKFRIMSARIGFLRGGS